MEAPHLHTAGAHPAAPFAASLTLFGMAGKLWLAARTIDATTLAALLGGAGTLFIGVANLIREVRTTFERRAAQR